MLVALLGVSVVGGASYHFSTTFKSRLQAAKFDMVEVLQKGVSEGSIGARLQVQELAW